MRKKWPRYYLHHREGYYRLFSIRMTVEGALLVERRFPAKDSHLSRKRGVGYESSKQKFIPEWKEAIEYLGCFEIPLDQLAPCREEETDPQRRFTLPNKQENLLVHLCVIAPGHEKEFEKYLPSSTGTIIARYLEKETHPRTGIILA